MKETFYSYIENLQDIITSRLEEIDKKATFEEDLWKRAEGGGGRTRVIENGNVIEKGGVNISAVHGELPEVLRKQFGVEHGNFFACGLSLVIHPVNPFVPTVHANWRYFEMYNEKGEIVTQWFGGGQDRYNFVTEIGNSFLNSYVPIVEKRKDLSFTKEHKDWQEVRRGRYVEFNLVHDRGTLFGLKTNGRIESILMSLPPIVQWKYNHHPEEGSEEAKLLEVLATPKQWIK